MKLALNSPQSNLDEQGNQVEDFFEALKILLAKLEGVDFALLGSYNLFIQGIKVTPRDVDLLTDDEGIRKIGQTFDSEVIKKPENHYKETQFLIGKVEVHVVSCKNNPLHPDDFKKYIIWIEKENLKIPCMSLTSELAFYHGAGREKDRKKTLLLQERLSVGVVA